MPDRSRLSRRTAEAVRGVAVNQYKVFASRDFLATWASAGFSAIPAEKQKAQREAGLSA
jgi:hypothetical protein